MLAGRRILLIVTGGIAAYKTLELVRRLKERGAATTAILTRAGAEFVTPLSLSALTEEKVYDDLFSLTDEAEMGHIQLSRSADLLVVAPASADILARMAAGLANDLATTCLLATDKPVLVAPAMNVRMWEHPATIANMQALRRRGVLVVGPTEGPMACGEFGFGRMAEPADLLTAIEAHFAGPASAALKGIKVLVTSGPTHEPIDPVRYIANRSSGKQGHAIAGAFAGMGADVTLVTGPVGEPDPPGVSVVRIETAREMLDASLAAMPVDVAVMAAAVADWRVEEAASVKLKKDAGAAAPTLKLVENPDTLAAVAALGPRRPRLVVGFAAETGDVAAKAREKLKRKGCDWILANDVSPGTGTFGGEENEVRLVASDFEEAWPRAAKSVIGQRLAEAVARALGRIA